MNLKTRIQHANSLPEEIRQRAISRMQEQLIFIDWHEEFLSLELCLCSSFDLRESHEGELFWREVIHNYNNHPIQVSRFYFESNNVKHYGYIE